MSDSPITSTNSPSEPPENGTEAPITIRPSLTLAEAANACGVHKSTIRRSLDGGDFPTAWQEPGQAGTATGRWRVPIEDLLQAGYSPNSYKVDSEPAREPAPEPLMEVIKLAGEKREAQLEAEKWKMIANERGQSNEDLRRALRMLEAAPKPSFQLLETEVTTGDATTELPFVRFVPKPRRRFFRRG